MPGPAPSGQQPVRTEPAGRPLRPAAGSNPGGRIVVTRFECPSIRALLLIALLHLRLGPSVRRRTTGLLGIKLFIRWRARVVYNVSLWAAFDDIYSMGSVPLHVAATRLTARWNVRTACGIYDCAGDWRALMFGGVGDDLPRGVIP